MQKIDFCGNSFSWFVKNPSFDFHWRGFIGNGKAQKLSCTAIPLMNDLSTRLVLNRSRIKLYLISSHCVFTLKVSKEST